MDKTILYLEDIPRRYPGPPVLRSLGLMKQKDQPVDQAIPWPNYSWILKGDGFYQVEEGPVQAIRAPCLLLKQPNRRYQYGPTTTWDEAYTIYTTDSEPALTQSKLLPTLDRPVAVSGRIVRRILDLFLSIDPVIGREADLLDRTAEQLLVESLIIDAETRNAEDPAGQSIRAMRHTLLTDPGVDHDLAELARDNGLSPVHARRLWKRDFGKTPGRFLAEIRHTMACKLLLEERLSIAEIAREVGYPDQRYFSRRFQHFAGMSPTRFRERHRMG